MKKVNFLFFIAITAVLAGCDSKNIMLYPSFTHSAEAIVKHEGTYNESVDVYVNEISEAINDLETDGEITDLMIEGIYLDVTKNAATGYPENTATSITSDIVLTGWDGTEYLLIENLAIDLTQPSQKIFLQYALRIDGVKELREILYDIAQNNIPAGKEKVSITLTGSPTPSNGYINAKLELNIKIVVEYSDEL